LQFNAAKAGPLSLASSLQIGTSVEDNAGPKIIIPVPEPVEPTNVVRVIDRIVDTATTTVNVNNVGEESAITTINSTAQLTNSNNILVSTSPNVNDDGQVTVPKNQPASEIGGTETSNSNFSTHQPLGTGVITGSGTSNNYFNLDVGNVVFRPTNDIVVGTHEGNVSIASGSIVFVMETGHDVAVYNLHDTKSGGVKISMGGKQVTVHPGTSVVLTRQDKADFSKVNPGVRIGHRNPVPVSMGEGVKAYYSEFSITSALYTVAPLKQMLASKSPADRKAAEHMLKNAVILSELSKSTSPFKSGSGTP
jgi:hypothetical protein